MNKSKKKDESIRKARLDEHDRLAQREQQTAQATLANDVGIREARQRFGGVDLPAVVGGTLAVLGAMLLLAIVGAALGVAGDIATDVGTESMTTAAAIAGVVVLAASAWAGGWVAGRLARYDGATNGTLAALTMVLIVVLAVAAGGATVADAEGLMGADVLSRYGTSEVDMAAAGGIALLVLLSIAAGWVGGSIGEAYHRRADALIAQPDMGRLPAPADARIYGHGEAALTGGRGRVDAQR